MTSFALSLALNGLIFAPDVCVDALVGLGGLSLASLPFSDLIGHRRWFARDPVAPLGPLHNADRFCSLEIWQNVRWSRSLAGSTKGFCSTLSSTSTLVSTSWDAVRVVFVTLEPARKIPDASKTRHVRSFGPWVLLRTMPCRWTAACSRVYRPGGRKTCTWRR